MKLAIVAFPSVDEVDRQWIESFRSQHDPQASRLGVHFTLVFPFMAVPGEQRRNCRAGAVNPANIVHDSSHQGRPHWGPEATSSLCPMRAVLRLRRCTIACTRARSGRICALTSHSFHT